MSVNLANAINYRPYSRGIYYFILFLIWPLVALLVAIRNYSEREAKSIIYLFLVYYGLSFVIYSLGIDAAAYSLRLETNATLPFSEFFNIMGGMYSNDNSMDIVEPLISFIISRFTDNHRLLFGVYAAILGFFYLRSIDLLHNQYQANPGWNESIYLAFFALILPITYINGFRMWTAAWIFFFGAYHVVLKRDWRYLLVALSASLVHWSFLSANAILLVYFLAGNRNVFYIPLAIVSFIIPQFLVSTFQLISIRMGGGLQSRYEDYSNIEYILFRQADYEQAAWFLKIGNDLVLYYLIIAIIIIQLMNRSIMTGKKEKNLFSFLLLFLSFVNFGKSIPSFGDRFQIVFFLFGTLYLFMFSINKSEKKLGFLTILGLFPMLLYSVIILRQGFETLNAWILSPGLGMPFILSDISLAEILFP